LAASRGPGSLRAWSDDTDAAMVYSVRIVASSTYSSKGGDCAPGQK
jgi:hypothetical protein